MKKRAMLPMNVMDIKFSKIVIFSDQYIFLRNPRMLFDGLDDYLDIP